MSCSWATNVHTKWGKKHATQGDRRVRSCESRASRFWFQDLVQVDWGLGASQEGIEMAEVMK